VIAKHFSALIVWGGCNHYMVYGWKAVKKALFRELLPGDEVTLYWKRREVYSRSYC